MSATYDLRDRWCPWQLTSVIVCSSPWPLTRLLRRSWISLCSIVWLATLTHLTAMAQTASDPPNVALPYITTNGIGTLNGSGVNTRVVSISPTVKLLDHAERKVGVGLRLSGALMGVDLSDVLEDNLNDVTAFGLTAGVELRIPRGRNVLLRPYVDIGGLVNTRPEGADALYLGGGLLTELVFWSGALEFGLEPRLAFAWTRSEEEVLEEEYTALFLKTDLRHPLWFSGGRYLPSFGVYVQGGYYFNQIIVGEDDRITTDLEGGISFGLCPRPKIVVFRLPRVSVGYRTSGAIRGWRITFSDRLLRCSEDRRR